jgi:hypothetical protein
MHMKQFLVMFGSLAFLGVLMVSLFATRALAGSPGCYVPELDPGLLSSGVAVFAGSMLLLRERLHRE